jgi:hypothetical protein
MKCQTSACLLLLESISLLSDRFASMMRACIIVFSSASIDFLSMKFGDETDTLADRDEKQRREKQIVKKSRFSVDRSPSSILYL